jgi:hypothetical protein
MHHCIPVFCLTPPASQWGGSTRVTCRFDCSQEVLEFMSMCLCSFVSWLSYGSVFGLYEKYLCRTIEFPLASQSHNKIGTGLARGSWGERPMSGMGGGFVSSLLICLSVLLFFYFFFWLMSVYLCVSILLEPVLQCPTFSETISYHSRSQWPSGLRHELTSLAWTLGSCFRIPSSHGCLCVYSVCR